VVLKKQTFPRDSPRDHAAGGAAGLAGLGAVPAWAAWEPRARGRQRCRAPGAARCGTALLAWPSSQGSLLISPRHLADPGPRNLGHRPPAQHGVSQTPASLPAAAAVPAGSTDTHRGQTSPHQGSARSTARGAAARRASGRAPPRTRLPRPCEPRLPASWGRTVTLNL